VKIPPYRELIDIYERAMAPVRPTRTIGVCLNTYDMSDRDARGAIARAAEETGLPATDPVRYGPEPLVAAVLNAARQGKHR